MQAGDATQLLESVVTKDAELPEEAFDRLGVTTSFVLVGTALELAARRRFGDAAGPRVISEYASQLRRRYPDSADSIKPMVAEAVLRAALGEDDMLDGIPVQEVFSVSVLATFALVQDLELDENQLAAFISEVIGAAAALEAEG